MNTHRDGITAADRSYFDRESVWAALTEGERQRIVETLALFPESVRSILNVGCGDGRVTRAVKENYEIVGVDLSATAARLFHGTALLGSIDALPFRDRSFDLVLATEVLEHLPDRIYAEALKELQRVAGRYLLVTVPNDENLEANLIKCSRCGKIYHAWTHLRRFSQQQLEMLLPSFHLERVVPLGFSVPVMPRWPYRILQTLGDTWGDAPQALCPTCGALSSSPNVGNRFGWLWQRFVWRMYKWTPWQKKAFLGALYCRIED